MLLSDSNRREVAAGLQMNVWPVKKCAAPRLTRRETYRSDLSFHLWHSKQRAVGLKAWIKLRLDWNIYVKTLRRSESFMWTKWVQEGRAGSYSCVRFPSRLAVGRCKASGSDSIRRKHEQRFSSSAHSLKMCWHQFSWFVKTGQSCFSDEWPTGGFWCNLCPSCCQDAGKVTQPWL